MCEVKKGDWVIAKTAKVADSFFTRSKGLLGTKEWNQFDGLLIRPCNSIHTFFMAITIDVIFLTQDYKVVKVFEAMKPWRITRPYMSAYQVLELPKGTLANRLRTHDQLEVRYV